VSTVFSVILEDFDAALVPLKEIVHSGQAAGASARARVASVHATTLLLAATFEEFVREMAKEYAIQVVARASSVADLPDSLLETAWRRTFDRFARNKTTASTKREALRISAAQARPTIEALCAFIEGDIGQDIFNHLIHNENNMRAGEINSLFKLSGLSNVCREACKQIELKTFFETDDDGKAHGEFLATLETFFERRNEIAHSLTSVRSSAAEVILADLEFLRAFSKSLCGTLEKILA
jgi:hypothetical protein